MSDTPKLIDIVTGGNADQIAPSTPPAGDPAPPAAPTGTSTPAPAASANTPVAPASASTHRATTATSSAAASTTPPASTVGQQPPGPLGWMATPPPAQPVGGLADIVHFTDHGKPPPGLTTKLPSGATYTTTADGGSAWTLPKSPATVRSTTEPLMQFPPGTDPTIRNAVQTSIDRLWSALGRATPVTTDAANVPPGVAASDPGIGAYSNVLTGMQTVRDQFVSAEAQLARLISMSATNTTQARQAILDCVDEFNAAILDVDTTTPGGQKQLLTRIQTALDKAQQAVQTAATATADPPALPNDTGPHTKSDVKDPTKPDPGSTTTDPKSPSTAEITPDTLSGLATGTDEDDGYTDDPYGSLLDTPAVSPYDSSAMSNPYGAMSNPYAAMAANPMTNPMTNPMLNPYGQQQMNPMMSSPLSSLPGLIQALSKTPSADTATPAPAPEPAPAAADPAPAATADPPDDITPPATLAPEPTTDTPSPAQAPTAVATTPTVPVTSSTPVAPAAPAPPAPGTDPAATTSPTPTALPAPGPAPGDPKVTLPDGSQQTAPNPEAAQAVRNALANSSNAGDAAQSAYAGTRVTIPAGHDPGSPIDPADMAPGDVAVWGDHTAVIAGPGQAIDHGKLRPIAEMMSDGTDFKGFFRPTQPLTDPTPPTPADTRS
ncbi:hypothetical protein OG921_24145 [Aldersonia sp. NBC_00410]|uniref:hypothetical protein n=1 Tax=Aldersonia sp. NBC_00410 TaxID=2975954 RepID=UPI00225A64D1|nr:hypothetical protein [Aldersonia sp. NBC_00410]MCX5046267.1 hypothetical protein [Aldersonia sp. NBC_00410]